VFAGWVNRHQQAVSEYLQAENLSLHMERFVKTQRSECLDHLFGERHLSHMMKQFIGHHMMERKRVAREPV